MRYPTILAAAIALPLLSSAASGQTAEEAHKAEVSKQARTCENMLVIGHPALEDTDVVGRCSQAASLQEDVLQGKALPDPLPDIDVQAALEKWRAKAAAYQDRKPQPAKNVLPEARKPTAGFRLSRSGEPPGVRWSDDGRRLPAAPQVSLVTAAGTAASGA